MVLSRRSKRRFGGRSLRHFLLDAPLATSAVFAGAGIASASGFLPEVWIANEATQAMCRQVTRRTQIVR